MDNSYTCQHCGASITEDTIVCTYCGRQVRALARESQPMPQIVINNTNQNVNQNVAATPVILVRGKMVNKKTAFWLCVFAGYFGAHKFYEGKPRTGLLYLFTLGLCGIGWIIDLISISKKSDPYYV